MYNCVKHKIRVVLRHVEPKFVEFHNFTICEVNYEDFLGSSLSLPKIPLLILCSRPVRIILRVNLRNMGHIVFVRNSRRSF